MEWFRKIKNGAILVDLLLIITAIIAIVGLATFVRIRGTNHIKTIAQKSTLAVSIQKLEAFTAEPEDAGKPLGTSQSSCKSNCRAKQSTLNINPSNNTCDNQAKLQLVDNYNRQVIGENERYVNELKTKLNVSTKSDESALQSTSSRHNEVLNELLYTYKSDLSEIYCLS